MRRRLLILAWFGFCAALGAGAAMRLSVWNAGKRWIDRNHCDRIKEGMSEAEVAAILGGGPGDFTTDRDGYSVKYEYQPKDPGPFGTPDQALRAARVEFWIDDWGRITVLFDGQDRVVSARFHRAARRRPPTVWDWLRRLRP